MFTHRGIFFLQSILIVALATLAVYVGRDELREVTGLGGQTPAATTARGADGDGGNDVRVSEAVQKASGIETAPLKARELHRGVAIRALVVDAGPLAALRTRLAEALREAEALRAAASRSAADLRRVRALFEDDRNASERALQAAEAEEAASAARLAASGATLAGLRDQLRRQWGETLARQAEAGQAPELERLLDGRDALLLVTLPLGQPPPERMERVELTLPGGKTQRGALVSAATAADPGVPGATWYFRATASGLRVGERLAGRLPLGGKAVEGVVVPASAVIWHAGTAWVYLKEAADRFERHAVDTAEPAGDGWFAAGLEAGDPVVVRGAQLLLSEELRGQITNENED